MSGAERVCMHTDALTPPRPVFLATRILCPSPRRAAHLTGTHPPSRAGVCTHGRRGGSLGVGRSAEQEQGAGVIQPSAGKLAVPTLCLFLLRSEARVCRAGG